MPCLVPAARGGGGLQPENRGYDPALLLLPGWPWASYPTSLCRGSSTWKMGQRHYLPHRIDVKKKRVHALAGVAQLVGASSSKPKGLGFNSQSGHLPRLRVRSPVGAHMRGKRLMFPLTPLFLCPPHPALSSPLSLKSISMSSGEDYKKKE